MPTSEAHPADVGSSLKRARTQRGLSMDAVQQKIRIQRKFLEAMETNHFQDFPAPVYLRGFLRTYCEFLELEFDPLWSQVSQEIQKPGPLPPPTPPAHSPPNAGLALGLAATALLALGAGWWIFAPRNGPEPPAPPPREDSPISPLHPRRAMTLVLEFQERAWVRVSGDGKLRFEGWAPAGARQEWTAMERFALRTDEPAAIRTVLDGRPAPLEEAKSGEPGEYRFEAPAR